MPPILSLPRLCLPLYAGAPIRNAYNGARRRRQRDAQGAAAALAAEARAAEAEARIAEQAAEREAMASRIAELEKSVEDLSAPAPDPPAADEKPVCGCVIA